MTVEYISPQRPKSHVGGRRPGAGRPKGSPNKAPLDRLRRIMIDGHTPLEVMLANMRRYYTAALKREQQHDTIADELREHAQRCAMAAAPYCHSRHSIATVRHEVAVAELTDEELAMIAAGNRHDTKTIEHDAGEQQPQQQPQQQQLAMTWAEYSSMPAQRSGDGGG